MNLWIGFLIVIIAIIIWGCLRQRAPVHIAPMSQLSAHAIEPNEPAQSPIKSM